LLVLFAACGGCEDFRWPGNDLALRPEVSAEKSHALDRWTWDITVAAERWNLAAERAGCAVRFRVVEAGGYAVRLYAKSEWPFDPETRGSTLGGSHGVIDVRDRWDPRTTGNMPTLLHELGHALGLEHIDDPASVMRKKTNLLTPGDPDVAALARAGC
jgi:hypothetical protein